MKSKFITMVFLVVGFILPGFFVVTAEINDNPRMISTNDFYDIQESPFFLMNGENEVPAKSELPSMVPFWHDLVDKEDVSQTGNGVYVAVLDTGLIPDWEFIFSEANIASELGIGFTHDFYWDEAIGDIVMSDLRSDRGFITDLASGHGTHVTSTIVGWNLANQNWVEGIAPDVTVIPVLVLDAWNIETPFGQVQYSGGTDAMICAGIYYIANLAESLDGPVVINMSLGGPEPTPEIEEAIDYAIEQGVIVVCSAGNSGEAGMGYPGAYNQVISVASCGWTDMFTHGWNADVPERLFTNDSLGNDFQVYLAPYSSRPNNTLGQKYSDLDVMAPGDWIVGPYKASGAPGNEWGYYYLSGTSMSAPHVSAMAALILEIFPDFDQQDIEIILKLAASGVWFNYLRGFPMTGEDVVVAYFGGANYTVSWERHDYGRGFLKADAAVVTSMLYGLFCY